MTMFQHVEVDSTETMQDLVRIGRNHANATHDFLTTLHSRLVKDLEYTLRAQGVGGGLFGGDAGMHARAAMRPVLYIARLELDIAKAWPVWDLKWKQHFVQTMQEAEIAKKSSRRIVKV